MISTIVCMFIIPEILNGQAFQFKNFGVENNLPSKVIYTINQSPDGYLWVGTTVGLSRFDGFEFYRSVFPDSVTTRYPTASVRDHNGTLWFGCNDGTILYYRERTLHKIQTENTSAISVILEDNDGFIYAVSQRKSIYRIRTSRPADIKILSIKPDQYILSACFSADNELLLGTQENILVCSITGDSLITKETIEGFDYSRVMAITRMNDSNNFLVGTDGNGLFLLRKEETRSLLSRLVGYPKLELLTIKAIHPAKDNNYWIATTGSGAIRLSFSDRGDSLKSVQFLTRASGMAGDNVNVVFQDSEENIWIGFNGDGLSMLGTDAFEFIVPGNDSEPKSIIYVGKLGDDYFLGTPSGYYLINSQNYKTRIFVAFSSGGGRNEISSYNIDEEKNIWIGTKGGGMFLRNPAGRVAGFFRSGDSGSDYISNISILGDDIWLSTLNGVIIVSKKSGEIRKGYNINNGLPHNSINQVLLTSDGSGYVAAESDRLYRIDPDSGIIASSTPMYGMLLNKILALTIDKDRNIWAATQGNGIFKCYGDSVKNINTSGGIMSNYAYSILADNENNIWIGHERGFSKYNTLTGVTRTYETDFAKGGTCNPNAIYESPDGKILIGTTEGLIVYDRSKDRKNIMPPVNNINFITINDIDYPYREVFSLPYRKRYTVRVNYTGINFSNPEKVYYSTFLKNYDNDWTKISSSREVTYNLRDGKYEFNLISVNEDGLSQDIPLKFEINIRPPVWRTWWFITLMIILASGIVVIVVREREKAQKKIQEYLEKELEARTQVVIKQKEEIEIQNLEITDSINYARRIQASILPDVNKLREHFREAFVILRPRDIVSGDFYWFDKFDDEKFILVCADSTGHGVPGAFMSMIGSTLLQDIVLRQRISRPSEILSMLDKQVFATLNQNLEVGVSNDGMDIVVCEFSLNNRHVRFASAMRPVIIVMGGEIYYIKGNRSSVGGQTVLEKYFDDQEYYLNEGDTIYLFTDGLPDQFGGPEGKKMKIARLKNLLSEISSLPVKQQEEMLLEYYLNWKGNYDQVDDILFMGVKI